MFYRKMTSLHGVSVIHLFKKRGFSAEFRLLFCFPHPTLHTLASPSIWGCKCANNTYSYLTHTHPHLVTGQTARQFHEIFPIRYCLVLNTCVILSWYHTVSVSAASWFSFNPFFMDLFCEEEEIEVYVLGFFCTFLNRKYVKSVETDILLLKLKISK